MGLIVFSGESPTLNAVRISKKYLSEDELFRLYRLVSAYFDLAEIKAKEQSLMKKNWEGELDKFLVSYGKGVLKGAGTVSHEQGNEKAEKEFQKFEVETLNTVEKAYLESLKQLECRLKPK